MKSYHVDSGAAEFIDRCFKVMNADGPFCAADCSGQSSPPGSSLTDGLPSRVGIPN
jgi:hypothetical protein